MADFSLLHLPRKARPSDTEAYLRSAIAWHFGEDTGSPYWLRTAKELDFDPLTGITTFSDLRLFPNLVDELRSVPVEDLIPRGYESPPPLPQIFESGGTTGAPKRTVQLPDWVEQVVHWQVEDFAAGGFISGRGLLSLMPSGPHGVGYFSRLVSEQLGSIYHSVDLDPRWVKKIVARNASTEVSAYVEHSSSRPNTFCRRKISATSMPRLRCWRPSPVTTVLSSWSIRRSATSCSVALIWTPTPWTCFARSSRMHGSQWRTAAP
jgi:hypothetical protein